MEIMYIEENGQKQQLVTSYKLETRIKDITPSEGKSSEQTAKIGEISVSEIDAMWE